MKTAIIIAVALAATPAMAQPRLDVPVTIMSPEVTTPLCFFFFCGLSLGAVPDGAGGFVPFTNSRVMPDGSLRPYDPAVDGMPGVVPGGRYPSLAPMSEPPTAYYDPPPPVAPRRPSPQTPWQWHDPNPSPEALPDTREWVEPQ
ncbi:MAG: hypothetical protein WBG11_14510 [Methylocella sp.]